MHVRVVPSASSPRLRSRPAADRVPYDSPPMASSYPPGLVPLFARRGRWPLRRAVRQRCVDRPGRGGVPASTTIETSRPRLPGRRRRPTESHRADRAGIAHRPRIGPSPGPDAGPIEWQDFDEGVEAARSTCRSTTTTRRARRSSCSWPVACADDQANRSVRCSSTRAGRASAAATSRLNAEFRSTARSSSSASTSSGGTRAAPGRSEPAIDCVDDYDATSRLDITPDDDAERAARSSTWPRSSPQQCEAKNGEILPHRRHQQLGSRHGLDPPGARRGRDHLLRLQLRQRARGDLGDAVPRHGPRRGPRRGRRTRTPTRARAASSRPRGFEATLDDVPGRSAAPTRRARSTTAATPRAAFDALMAQLDE